MKISRKTDYALRVLFTLIECRGQAPLSMNQLARRNGIPKRFLEHIMLDLKKKKWVASAPGCKGGYTLVEDPQRITMGEVIRHFDGVLAPIGCVSVAHHESCSQSPTCRFRRVFLEVRNLTASYLDNLNLAAVYGQEPVTHHEVFSLTLLQGEGI
jgi:Rrf2 family protein